MPIDPNVLTPTLIKPISVAGVVHDAAVAQEAQARAQAYRDKQMEMARDRQENDQIRAVLQQSGGQLDDQTLGAIRQISVPKAMDIEKLHNDSTKSSMEIENAKIDHDLKVLGYTSRQLAGITDQHSYDMARAGIKATTGQDLPEQYDPALVQSWQEKGMTYAEKLNQQREDRAAKFQELTATRQQTAEERAAAAQAETVRHNQATEANAAANLGVRRQEAAKSGGGGGKGGGEVLSTGPGGGLESLATQFRLMKRFPVGMARTIDKDDAKRVVNLAAEQDRLIGRSPAASIQKAAMFQANAKAAGQMAVLGAGTEAAESKALGQIGIIKELSPKVWRTSSTGINEWLVNPTQRFTGNKDAQSLANAILTFSSEYAKIINGSVGSVAGASDSARNDAARLISNALNHGNLMQQLDLMKREMALTRVGYDVAQQHIAEQMQGPQVPGAQQAAPQGGVTPPAPKVQSWVRDKNGKLVPQ